MTLVGYKTEQRRRRARYLVALAALLAIGIVAETYRRRNATRTKVVTPTSILPKGVHQELSGFTYTRSEGGRRVFAIRAKRTLSLVKGRRAILQDVSVKFFGRSGRRYDLLRTQQGEYDGRSGDFSSSTRVELELNAGPPKHPSQSVAGKSLLHSIYSGRGPIRIETSRIVYRHQGSLLETQAPVRFTVGPLSGTAVGMAYATRAGWLELQHEVKVTLHPAAGSRIEEPIYLSARRFRYDHRRARGELWGPLRIWQAGHSAVAGRAWLRVNASNRVTDVLLGEGVEISQVSAKRKTFINADRVEGWLTPSTEQLDLLKAEGHVRASSVRGQALTQLEADKARVDLVGGKPTSGSAVGDVNVHFASLATRPSQLATSPNSQHGSETLRTSRLNFILRPGGKALEKAATQGPAQLMMWPRQRASAPAKLYAGRLEFQFDAQSRLTSLRGSGGTRLVVPSTAGARQSDLPAVSTSERLVAIFNPATETLVQAKQSGDFHYTRGDQQATATRAQYDALTETLILTGQPQAWNPTARLRAWRIELQQKAKAMEGVGNVQASYAEPTQGSALPSHVLADRVEVLRAENLIRFQGNVRAWHGRDVIEAPSLEIFRQAHRASAGPSVVSSFLGAGTLGALDPSDAHASGHVQAVTIRADHLDYFDQDRKASYLGHVVMKTQNSVLRADRLDIYLARTKAEITRALAEGHVRITQPGRWARGDRAVYSAPTGDVVMTGGPPTLYDASRGLTTGRRLTFSIRNDTVRVDEGRNFTRPPRPSVAP